MIYTGTSLWFSDSRPFNESTHYHPSNALDASKVVISILPRRRNIESTWPQLSGLSLENTKVVQMVHISSCVWNLQWWSYMSEKTWIYEWPTTHTSVLRARLINKIHSNLGTLPKKDYARNEEEGVFNQKRKNFSNRIIACSIVFTWILPSNIYHIYFLLLLYTLRISRK